MAWDNIIEKSKRWDNIIDNITGKSKRWVNIINTITEKKKKREIISLIIALRKETCNNFIVNIIKKSK